MSRRTLMHDLGMLLVIGLIGALIFVLNYRLVRRTRWGS